MLSLTETDVTLVNVNPRTERHGEDPVLAADLKLSFKTSNDILSEFHPSLKSAFYGKQGGSQGELVDDPGHLPELRFPQLGRVKWEKQFTGYELRFHWGASGKDDIVLEDCKVDKFAFDCLDGGSVVFSFRVQAHPDEKQVGRLCALIQSTAMISLIPPEADEA